MLLVDIAQDTLEFRHSRVHIDGLQDLLNVRDYLGWFQHPVIGLSLIDMLIEPAIESIHILFELWSLLAPELEWQFVRRKD